MRYAELVEKTKTAVLKSRGATDPALREAIAVGPATAIPAALRAYVEKVALHAYRVTDEDVIALKRSGYSEDQIFEITAAAALGASLQRLQRGLAVLEASAAIEEAHR